MDAHSQRAQDLAEWLEQHPGVKKVNYCGLAFHPDHALAVSQQPAFGGVLSFDVDGRRDRAWALINTVQLMSLTANFGDVKTTVCHPASTTHGRLNDERKQQGGITEGLIRIAVELEDLEDLKGDCGRGFAAICS